MLALELALDRIELAPHVLHARVGLHGDARMRGVRPDPICVRNESMRADVARANGAKALRGATGGADSPVQKADLCSRIISV